MDRATRHVLAWRLSNTMDASFCIGALDDALLRATPEILNTDQGAQFTSEAFAERVLGADVAFSMDGRGRFLEVGDGVEDAAADPLLCHLKVPARIREFGSAQPYSSTFCWTDGRIAAISDNETGEAARPAGRPLLVACRRVKGPET